MNQLKRQIIDAILECRDPQLLGTIYKLLALEQPPPPFTRESESFRNKNIRAHAIDLDVKDLQNDIDEVFGPRS